MNKIEIRTKSIDIVPGTGAGDIKIGESILSYSHFIQTNIKDVELFFETPFHICYKINRQISLFVKVKDSLIYKISCHRDIVLSINNKKVSNYKIMDLIDLGFTLFYDNFDNLIYFKEQYGICLEIKDYNDKIPLIENEVLNFTIYDKQLDLMLDRDSLIRIMLPPLGGI